MAALVIAGQVGSAAFHPSAAGAATTIAPRRAGFMLGVFLAGGYVGYSLSQLLFTAVYAAAPLSTPLIGLLPLGAAAAIACARAADRAAAARRAASHWASLVAARRRSSSLFAVQVLRQRRQHDVDLPAAGPAAAAPRARPGWSRAAATSRSSPAAAWRCCPRATPPTAGAPGACSRSANLAQRRRCCWAARADARLAGRTSRWCSASARSTA